MDKSIQDIQKEEREVASLTFIGIMLTLVLIIVLTLGLSNVFLDRGRQAPGISPEGMLHFYVTECIKSSVILAKEVYGLEGDMGEAEFATAENIKECTDGFKDLRPFGFTVDEGNISVVIAKTGDKVSSRVRYPITLSRNSLTTQIESFMFTLEPSLVLNHDSGMILAGKRFQSEDGSISMTFHDDTQIISKGAIPGRIGLAFVYDNFLSMYDVAVGVIVFEDMEGIELSSPATLSIKIPRASATAYDPSYLKIATFDKRSGLWNIVQGTSIAENEDHLLLTARIQKI